MGSLADNFNRTDNAAALGTPSDGGSAWSVLSGTWGISSNTAYQPSAAAQVVAVRDSSTSDVAVEAIIGGTITDAGLICRATDDSNYILAVIKTNQVVVYRKQAGSFNALATITPTIVSGDTIALVALGSAVSIYQNSVLLAGSSVTETFNQTATKHGIRANVDSGVRFDNFYVADATLWMRSFRQSTGNAHKPSVSSGSVSLSTGNFLKA